MIEIQWPIEIRESVFVVSVYGERREEEEEEDEEEEGVKNTPKHPPHPRLLYRPKKHSGRRLRSRASGAGLPLCAALSRSVASQCYY